MKVLDIQTTGTESKSIIYASIAWPPDTEDGGRDTRVISERRRYSLRFLVVHLAFVALNEGSTRTILSVKLSGTTIRTTHVIMTK
jgi:hypothetical protein